MTAAVLKELTDQTINKNSILIINVIVEVFFFFFFIKPKKEINSPSFYNVCYHLQTASNMPAAMAFKNKPKQTCNSQFSPLT